MNRSRAPIPVAFPGFEPARATIPLAAALGLGVHPRTIAGDERFRELERTAPARLQLVEEGQAQVFIYPHPFEAGAGVNQVSRLSADLGIPVLFFLPNETMDPTYVQRGIVYRYSMTGSNARPHERVMPALVPDVLGELSGISQGWTPRVWSEVPLVGFCGYTGFALNRVAFRVIGKREKARGLEIRAKAARTLLASEYVDTDFVLRKQFWGGAKNPIPMLKTDSRTVREEFLRNMLANDYNLAPRGKGNYSFRFYEALACGRIPIFINTDSVLPFPDRIEWREHVVWVELDDLERLDQVLMEFHERHRGPAFERLQLRNRGLWERWLRPGSFFLQAIKDALGRDTSKSSGLQVGTSA